MAPHWGDQGRVFFHRLVEQTFRYDQTMFFIRNCNCKYKKILVRTIVKMCTIRKPVIGWFSWKLIKKRYCSCQPLRRGYNLCSSLSVRRNIGGVSGWSGSQIYGQMVKACEKSLLRRNVVIMWAVEEFFVFNLFSNNIRGVSVLWEK